MTMEMELMRVMYVDYTPADEPDEGYSSDDLSVRVVGRTADGERDVQYVEGLVPHLFVPADADRPEPQTDEWQVLDVSEPSYEGIDIDDGGRVPVRKVELAHPDQVKAYAEEFDETYEADIRFERRATWDHNLSGYIRVPSAVSSCSIEHIETAVDPESVDPIEPRVAIGDIEVLGDESVPFDVMKRRAEAPVISATWYDSYTDEYLVIVVDPEGETENADIKAEISEHWADHDLAETYVEDASITVSKVDTETDLFNRTLQFFQETRPDITAGWNWVDFDWYYLLSRMLDDDNVSVHDITDVGYVQGRKLNPDRRGVEGAAIGLPAFDQMSGLDQQTYGEWRSKALEFVASDQLGVGKISGITVSDAYEADRSRMTAYNLLDVQLTVALTEMHGIEEFFLDLADLAGIQIQDTWSEKRVVDGYIGSRRDDDQIMPSQTEKQIETPAGGLVLTPGDGIYDDVAVLDLKSLYPSGMVTCNISPETMVPIDEADIVIPGMPDKEADVNGSIEPSDINWENDDPSLPWSQRPKGFSYEQQGIIPEYAAQMFPHREQYKTARNQYEQGTRLYVVNDNRQGGVKVIHNSMFGVQNSKYYRLAKDGVGDAITGVSRYILWRAAEFIESLGYEVIYGDTDSVMISLDDGSDRNLEDKLLDGKGLCNQLNHHMQTVADDLGIPDPHPYVDASEMPHDLSDDVNHLWAFEFEKFYDRFIQVGSKKRYAGTKAWEEGDRLDGKLDVTGFEATRSDQMEITSEVQRQVIRGVLDGWGFNETSEMVRDEINRFDSEAEDLFEIGVPWNLNKPLSGPDSYGNLPQARSARFSNEHLDKDYSAGDDFRGYYVKRTPSFTPETDVIALDWTDEWPEGYQLARSKTIEQAFESALTPIIEEVGWTFNEIRAGKRNQPVAGDEIMEYEGDPFTSSTDVKASETVNVEETADEGSDDEDDDYDELGGAAAW